ncbi:ArdC family protein [Bradyrhizobium japonicum]|uniref:ArdC family protein n=1 Tax=Bradyrhizobium japonicum TaxID=375 RepID=UPI0004210FF0|nr:zincin-like metallopeptidase domain-containing protein [Bradyrhizobium japonicum]WLB90295.1 zincin-like metallopeptidase domain-containing protein [Bradyrhizobium japonicum USDA 135]
MKQANPTRRNAYQAITDQIIEELERGVRPWQQPWSTDHMAGRVQFPLRHNGIPYRGVNIIALWMASLAKGYRSPFWMTFKQALDLGGAVRKGERASLTVYANSITRTETNEATGEENASEIHYMKGYSVFNTEQIDGLPAHYNAPPEPVAEPRPRIERAESYFSALNADIRHGGTEAYYVIGSDYIQMPPFEGFVDAESYYATLAHEATHWTRHPSRLDRDLGRKRFGDAGYAMEELVAELGSAFTCATLDLNPALREQHASYIANWLKVLKEDKRAIFAAAAHAQAAADFLNARQPGAASERETA